MDIFSKSFKLNKRKKVILVLSFILLFFWTTILATNGHSELRYRNLIKKAENFENQKIYYDAQNIYIEAFEKRPSEKLAFKIADLSLLNDDEKSFIKFCDYIISKGQKKDEARIKKANFYYSNEQYSECYKEIQKIKNLKNNQRAKDLDYLLDGKYYIKYLPYTQGNRLIETEDKSYFTVLKRDEVCLIDEKSNVLLSNFKKLGDIHADKKLIAGYKDSNYSYYDFNGNRRYKNLDVDYLGRYSEVVPTMKENKFSFLNTQTGKNFGEYLFASNFSDKRAVILKENHWSVVDFSGKIVKNLEVKDFRFNNNDFENYGYIIMKTDKFYIYDKKFNKICDIPFDDILPLLEKDGYFAAKKNHKWGLIDAKGKTIVDFKYDNLHSSKLGYACAMKNGKWGYIKTDGREVIDFDFESATDLSKNGKAIVNKDGSCIMITLCKKL
ncbi:MAG: WG repeat-containing protein [Clostridia bacterium]|nr:WG repeat-containing protein [Clostridia bacterium]